MMFKLILENGWEIPLSVRDDIGEKMLTITPIISRLIKWKEEVYFETDLELEVEELTSRVKRGDFAYWPPGKALCLFYGVSQPYTPLRIIGESIGTIGFLRDVESESIVRVEVYQDYDEVKEVCAFLRNLGYEAASRKDDEGFVSVVLNVCCKNVKIGVDLFVETYGIYVESDDIAAYEGTLAEKVVLWNVRKNINERSRRVRLDLNERFMLCLSACCENLKELPELLNEFKNCIGVLKGYI